MLELVSLYVLFSSLAMLSFRYSYCNRSKTLSELLVLHYQRNQAGNWHIGYAEFFSLCSVGIWMRDME